jgi:hypothetical protein
MIINELDTVPLCGRLTYLIDVNNIAISSGSARQRRFDALRLPREVVLHVTHVGGPQFSADLRIRRCRNDMAKTEDILAFAVTPGAWQ